MRHKSAWKAVLLTLMMCLTGTVACARADLFLPSGIQVIGEEAYLDDSGVNGSVTLPDQIRMVGQDAFTGTELFSLIFPQGTVSVAGSTVDSLVWLRFRGSTTQVAEELLRSAEYVIGVGGSSVEQAAKDAGVPFVRSDRILEKDGWLYQRTESGVVLLSAVDNRTIPETVTLPSEINNYTLEGVSSWAFSGCDRMKKLVIPKSGKNWSIQVPKTVTLEDYDDASAYQTLTPGCKGTAVEKLTTALKEKGYLAEVTDRYGKDVLEAVRKFQSKNGLMANGIADIATQEKLYEGKTSVESKEDQMTMTLYPAEKIDWWTGGINILWAKGANYQIYDVKTGIIWWAHRWSGGYHADIEPLTAEDTARLCQIYGVSSAEEIEKKNLYQRRPCLVTIGNRTFACSLYGVPHNPDGDTIADNNMTGQLCLHFTNSWTHVGSKVDPDHAAAIQYAWENSPSGHK